MLVSDEQPPKARSSMLVMESGKVIFVNDEQSLKA